MGLYGRAIRRWERKLTRRDTNRRVLPFEWGVDWVGQNGSTRSDPVRCLREHADRALADSDDFFAPGTLIDWDLTGDRLTFPSAAPGKDEFNNTARARLFEARGSQRAVVVVPQWNAEADSHVTLCRLLRRLGITALRLCLPYHEERLPPGMKRADYMVSPNIGRTLQATRQAVLELRQAAQWLRNRGYPRVGVVGTSIGSCVSYLGFVHDSTIDAGVFNHVSSYFADVVWTGLSTRYVRRGLEPHVSLDELRHFWKPISPFYFIPRMRGDDRPHLLITAKYDLSFLPGLSDLVFQQYKASGARCNRAELPCGHYTTAHFPFKYIDGWHICSFLHRNL